MGWEANRVATEIVDMLKRDYHIPDERLRAEVTDKISCILTKAKFEEVERLKEICRRVFVEFDIELLPLEASELLLSAADQK